MNTKKHIHFVGIGGIGMSGIAQILAQKGLTVSGCDTDCSQKSILLLQALGCNIANHHDSTLCNDETIDTVVYSTDIRRTNPEIERAQKKGIPLLHRSEMLSQIMAFHDFSIGITGSHGKTTTTSLAAHIFLTAQKHPTVVVGGILSTIESNACLGDEKIALVEADESDRSLLNLPITHAVLTSISAEHLNVFRDITDIQEMFLQFLHKVPAHGKSFLCVDDKNIQTIIPQITTPYETYGTTETADWHIKDIVLHSTSSHFSLDYKGSTFGNFTLALAGIHNVKNATATIALAHHFGIETENIQSALQSFAGVDRRFTFKGLTSQNAEVFDDYGHHPVELFHTFQVARNRAKKRFILLFQLHRYTRTKALWNDFLAILASPLIDHIILTDLHSASEDPLEGITAQAFYQDFIKHHPKISVVYKPIDQDFSSITTYLNTVLKADDLLLIQGAGKITKISERLISKAQ